MQLFFNFITLLFFLTWINPLAKTPQFFLGSKKNIFLLTQVWKDERFAVKEITHPRFCDRLFLRYLLKVIKIVCGYAHKEWNTQKWRFYMRHSLGKLINSCKLNRIISGAQTTSSDSLSIRRFWGKRERWKLKRETASFLFSPSPLPNLKSPLPWSLRKAWY